MAREKFRDRIAVRLCNWILVHVASEHYRLMVTGALKLGLVTAAENELDGQEIHDLIESLGQMARGETVPARTKEEEDDLGMCRACGPEDYGPCTCKIPCKSICCTAGF